MKKYLSLIKSAIVFLLFNVIYVQNVSASFSPEPSPLASNRVSFVPGRLLVKYKQSTPPGLINNINAAEKATVVKEFPFVRLQLLQLAPGQSVATSAQKYNKNPTVDYAEPDYIYTSQTVTPNDPHFNKLWGLNNSGQIVDGSAGTTDKDIDAPEAWGTTTGTSGVIIGVLDSGVAWNHEDLAANIWINSSETLNSSDSDNNGRVDDIQGWDFVDNDNNPFDFNGHGTHVSGIIAAVGDNAKGVTGVSWNARIMSLRVLDTHGTGTISNIVAGIQYAISNGADIINASMGGADYSQIFSDAIEAAGDAGILVVTSAGNDSRDNDTEVSHYPSDYALNNIISVAATDSNDALASFSNYGAISVDVAAPGVNIMSTVPTATTAWSDNFDDADISDWLTGGPGSTWGVTGSGSMTDSPAGNYLNSSNNWAMSPEFNLSGLSGCTLNYTLTARLETDFDFLFIEASTDGINFSSIQEVSFFNDLSWFVSAPLNNVDGQASVYIRFRLFSDDSHVFDGVTIDNVNVTCIDSDYISTYAFASGTSMAAPHVTGLAALLLSRNDSLSVSELKDLILDYGDPVPALSGKTTSGKRINAFTSLSNTPLAQKLTQSINFAKLADKTYGDADFSLSASADSGLSVSFSSITPSVCTVHTASVSIISTGTCSIRASQAGDINYLAAIDVVQSFNVLKASISSFISSPASGLTGDSTTLSTSASPSTSPVIYTSITPDICTVSGTTVTLLESGICTVTANQAGDENYNASPEQTLNIIVSDANESYIETGLGHTCFKNKDNEVQCWGR